MTPPPASASPSPARRVALRSNRPAGRPANGPASWASSSRLEGGADPVAQRLEPGRRPRLLGVADALRHFPPPLAPPPDVPGAGGDVQRATSSVRGGPPSAGYSGTCATMRSGPPEPPSIFIGSATMVAPTGGSADMSATFSKAGMSLVISATWVSKFFDWP